LLGRPAPEFSLPALEGVDLPALASADLRGPLPGPVLVNFWASWCAPCIIEHPQLMRLSREGVAVYGINYKDRVAEAGFRQIAKVSGGAWAPFDADSAEALRALLRAVAVFAAGGRAALTRLPGREAARIAGQLPAPGR
jgi:thiol-disulfide isomerase/thioredoxin